MRFSSRKGRKGFNERSSEMMVAPSSPSSRPLRGHCTTAGKGVGFCDMTGHDGHTEVTGESRL